MEMVVWLEWSNLSLRSASLKLSAQIKSQITVDVE